MDIDPETGLGNEYVETEFKFSWLDLLEETEPVNNGENEETEVTRVIVESELTLDVEGMVSEAVIVVIKCIPDSIRVL